MGRPLPALAALALGLAGCPPSPVACPAVYLPPRLSAAPLEVTAGTPVVLAVDASVLGPCAQFPDLRSVRFAANGETLGEVVSGAPVPPAGRLTRYELEWTPRPGRHGVPKRGAAGVVVSAVALTEGGSVQALPERVTVVVSVPEPAGGR